MKIVLYLHIVHYNLHQSWGPSQLEGLAPLRVEPHTTAQQLSLYPHLCLSLYPPSLQTLSLPHVGCWDDCEGFVLVLGRLEHPSRRMRGVTLLSSQHHAHFYSPGSILLGRACGVLFRIDDVVNERGVSVMVQHHVPHLFLLRVYLQSLTCCVPLMVELYLCVPFITDKYFYVGRVESPNNTSPYSFK